nr:MlaD family protein [Nocardia bovistercoris]
MTELLPGSKRPPRVKRPRPVDSVDSRPVDLRWALGGIAVAVVLLVAIGVIYVNGTTPEREYTADLARAGSVREGDDVRLAGIPVGKVKKLDLMRDRVRMKFTVSDDVFVGDQTSLSVRMLTVVGGYYIALDPAGTSELGSEVIPQSRVVLPYNLSQAFQDAVRPVENVDGDTLRQNLAVLASSIDGSPDALRAAGRAARDIVTIMDKQNSDISRALNFADEYLTALNASSDVLVKLLDQLHVLEGIVRNDKTVIAEALVDVTAVVHGLAPLGRAWDRSLHEQARPLADAIPKLEELGGYLDTLFDSLRAMSDKLLPLTKGGNGFAVDQSAARVPVTRICVPIPGGGC